MADDIAVAPRTVAARIEARIHLIRGQRVMLDADLAALYGVATKSLNLAVRRNSRRFPADFMFQLTSTEVSGLRLQIETSNVGRGGRRYLPYAFTEQGVAMLSSVLRSERAAAVNILVTRTFVQLRRSASETAQLGDRIDSIERRVDVQGAVLEEILAALQAMERPQTRKGRKIGFRPRA